MVAKQFVKEDECIWSPMFQKLNRLMLVDNCPLTGQIKSQYWTSLGRHGMRVDIPYGEISQIFLHICIISLGKRKKKKNLQHPLLWDLPQSCWGKRIFRSVFLSTFLMLTLRKWRQRTIKWPKAHCEDGVQSSNALWTWLMKFGPAFTFSLFLHLLHAYKVRLASRPLKDPRDSVYGANWCLSWYSS